MKTLICSFLLVCALAACKNDLRDVMALPKNKLSPSQVGDSITMLYTDSAQLKIMVKANRMLIFSNNVSEPFTILPNGVYVTFFDQDEKVSATMRARYGIRYDRSRKMEAKYAVEVVNKNGEKLETEKLIWDEASERIYTDAFVKISTGKEIIMGEGMESNQDFTKYEIKKVTGQFNISTNEF
jgi:LPS export ABC transporter protein LptC